MSSDEEEFEPDVKSIVSFDSDASYEIVEQRNCAGKIQSFIVRLIAILIALGALTGCLIWSFKHGEAGINNGTHYRDASANFSIYVSEYTVSEGTYSITYRVPDANNNTLLPSDTYPSFWYQDDDNKRLVHRRDNVTTLYAFKEHAFWAQLDKNGEVKRCRYDPKMNYQLYIDRLGLANLTREHSAYESTHNHEKVFIFNGDPQDVIIEGTPQIAFLVTSYADAYTGALLGWDTYFTSSTESRVYLISYWYDSMTPTKPDENHFDIPAECEPDTS